MIVWINGLFGVGKSTTAKALAERMASPLVDPEMIGCGFAEAGVNGGPVADFQDIPGWRTLTAETVGTVAAEFGCVVVPMTLLNPHYFDEVVGVLRGHGQEVRHFTLVASQQTIVHRVSSRESGAAWGLGMNRTYAQAVSDPKFAEFIDTEGKLPEDVVDVLQKLVRV